MNITSVKFTEVMFFWSKCQVKSFKRTLNIILPS
ncbi:MAG: hypothetical protein UZ10_BCD003001755 [Bacteroidetes bacterium OLB10]|nr:MAG: hypothetical protein UZ10_BCD003001755 [Bacteroidetes bacterium OLB10]